MSTRVAIRLGLSVAMLSLITGCKAPAGHDRAEGAAESITSLNQRLDKASVQVDTVLASLDGVSSAAGSGGDLKAAYEKFSDAVDDTESAAESSRDRYASMRAKTEEHFKAWEAESLAVTDPELQKAAAGRRDAAKAAFAKVVEATGKVKGDYEPFMANLKDIRAFLSADLTSQGAGLIANNITRAKDEGGRLKGSIANVGQAVAEVRKELTATAAPAPKG